MVGKETKLLILGSTGDGKSSLGNFILRKSMFRESNDPTSETKVTIGSYGEEDRKDVFVIDTPGLQDTDGLDRNHMNQMIDFIKENPGLQAIAIVLNFHQDRFAQNIKTMIKLIWNIFPIEDFWKHVCVVWTKCYCYIPESVVKETKEPKVEKYQQQIGELIKETTGKSERIIIPMYFVDSKGQVGFDNKNSENEIVRLLTWVRELEPIDVEEVKEADPVYKTVTEEEKVDEVVIAQEKNIQKIELRYLKSYLYR